MKKKLLSLIFASFFTLSLASCGGGTSDKTDGGGSDPGEGDNPPVVVEVTPETYGSFWMRSHDYKTMPVGAFNSIPPRMSDFTYSYIDNEETFAAYAEARVNTLMALYENTTSASVEQALDWCYDYGLSYLVKLGGADSLVNDSIAKSTLMRVRYHDSFGGVMQCDEPGRIQYEKIKTSAGILDSIMPEETTGTLWHVNLFPIYANAKQLYFRQYTSSSVLPEEGYTYQQYVDDYMSIVQPKVLSYDYYPCRGEYGNLTDKYFVNMAIIREAALEANIPFWVYVQTCSYNSVTRLPDQADILWQVNTALSYGAKGIQYFTGVVPTNGDGTGEQFDGAMFDRHGNRTAIYDYVKNANLQIEAVDEVLMCSKSKGVIINGNMPWDGESGIPAADVLTSYGALASVTAQHAITGCFDYNGKAAFYVTNNNTLEQDTVTLNFSSGVSGYTVQKAAKTTFNGNSLSISLAAGEGVLVVLE